MAETDKTEAQGADANQEQPQVSNRVLAQYVRDMSFENILVQKGTQGKGQPNINVQVNLDARKRNEDDQYEVMMRLTIKNNDSESDQPIFVLELDYAALFEVKGVAEDQLHPYLLIECPRILFPFARRIVHDVTRDGGFPPLNLEMIDFVELYRQEIARRLEAQAAQGETASVN